jgi:hypothetical protein
VSRKDEEGEAREGGGRKELEINKKMKHTRRKGQRVRSGMVLSSIGE